MAAPVRHGVCRTRPTPPGTDHGCGTPSTGRAPAKCLAAAASRNADTSARGSCGPRQPSSSPLPCGHDAAPASQAGVTQRRHAVARAGWQRVRTVPEPFATHGWPLSTVPGQPDDACVPNVQWLQLVAKRNRQGREGVWIKSACAER